MEKTTSKVCWTNYELEKIEEARKILDKLSMGMLLIGGYPVDETFTNFKSFLFLPANSEKQEMLEAILANNSNTQLKRILRNGHCPQTNRNREWSDFSALVEEHIANYTVPQYGDAPNDQMTTATLDDIKHDMTRYINRMGKNSRGKTEDRRDMLKLAHYACIAATKMEDEDETSV